MYDQNCQHFSPIVGEILAFFITKTMLRMIKILHKPAAAL
jgi:hypothetical protein